jgi:hypothetical protein
VYEHDNASWCVRIVPEPVSHDSAIARVCDSHENLTDRPNIPTMHIGTICRHLMSRETGVGGSVPGVVVFVPTEKG